MCKALRQQGRYLLSSGLLLWMACRVSGVETAQYIRNEMAPPPLNAIPIIALTSHNPDIFFEDFSNVGFDELITKPYSVEKIRAKINELAA